MPATSIALKVIIFIWTILGGILLIECILTFYIFGQYTTQYNHPVDTAEDIQKLRLIPIMPSNIIYQYNSQFPNSHMISSLAGTYPYPIQIQEDHKTFSSSTAVRYYIPTLLIASSTDTRLKLVWIAIQWVETAQMCRSLHQCKIWKKIGPFFGIKLG